MQREGLARGRVQPELGANWLPPGLSKDSGKRCAKPKELHVRVFPYVKRKGSNFSQQIARRGLRLSSQQAKGMNTRVQKNQSLRGDRKKVFALVFLSLLTGSTLLGQVSQSNQQLTFRGISTLSAPAVMSPTEVGLQVQTYHRGHHAADGRPTMTSKLPLVPFRP